VFLNWSNAHQDSSSTDTVSIMKKTLLIGFLALGITACAPSYQQDRALLPTSGSIEINGIAVGKFSGELNYDVQNEFVTALRVKGYKQVIDTRLLTPQNIEVKVEGDTVTQRSNDPRPTKLEKGEARVYEMRTGRLLVKYNFVAEGPQQVRSPAEFARDIAALIAKDFRPRK
jgi:hypothetical protein